MRTPSSAHLTRFAIRVFRPEAPRVLQRTTSYLELAPEDYDPKSKSSATRNSIERYGVLEHAIGRAQRLLTWYPDVGCYHIYAVAGMGGRNRRLIGRVSRDRGFREA